MTTYPTPAFRRTALVPGVLAAIVLTAGAALVGTEGFTWVRYVTSILALVISVFAWQSRQWWWLIALLPIAVAWNPVIVLPFDGVAWQAVQFVAALVFITVGLMIKVPNPEDRNQR